MPYVVINTSTKELSTTINSSGVFIVEEYPDYASARLHRIFLNDQTKKSDGFYRYTRGTPWQVIFVDSLPEPVVTKFPRKINNITVIEKMNKYHYNKEYKVIPSFRDARKLEKEKKEKRRQSLKGTTPCIIRHNGPRIKQEEQKPKVIVRKKKKIKIKAKKRSAS